MFFCTTMEPQQKEEHVAEKYLLLHVAYSTQILNGDQSYFEWPLLCIH